MFFIQSLIFIISIAFGTASYAQPKQLDIVGIKPGVSSKEQVQKVFGKGGFFEIGGIRLICMAEYEQGRLGLFVCLTGEEYHSKDVTSGSERNLSNVKVHKLLSKGFRKKFGQPTIVKDSEVQNGLGMSFKDQVVMWEDKQGNRLRLMLRMDKIDEGLMIIESAERLSKEALEEKQEEQNRKF